MTKIRAGRTKPGLMRQHLTAWLAYGGDGQLVFWWTRAGAEVDFIVYWGTERLRIGEV